MDIGDRKSLDLYREIWVYLAQNQRYSGMVDTRDIVSFNNRLDHEGLTFLTCALPLIGKALDAFHSTGEWTAPSGFASDGDGVPHFLGAPIALALGGNSLAVDCVRQLTLMFYKLEVDYDPTQIADFLKRFEEVDGEVGTLALPTNSALVRIAREIVSRVLCNSDPRDIRPRHGSGSTACRTANHEKYHLLRFYSKLDEFFSYPDYFFYSLTHLVDEYEKLAESSGLDPMARVVLVPKDSRGPRVISCEPAELMFIQQGLMRKLYETLENHHLTKGHINFVDQGVNRELARQSSIDGKYCTLDLTDASDRVSMDLIRTIFPPAWVQALEASRSETTVLPNGRVVKLNKFAPMGSACCFPVEALCFYAVCHASMSISGEIDPEIYVYGDDIIVPAFQAEIVITALERVGLKVNTLKSYTKGPFRESCGGDFHNGMDVTPVRVRKPLGVSNSSITTDADLANLLGAKFGREGTILKIFHLIDEVHRIPLPRSPLNLPGCIDDECSSSNDAFYVRRWNFHLQRYEHRIRCVSTRALARSEATWSELLRKELTRGDERDNTGEYENPLKQLEASLKPGYYADVHSAREKWTWTWLG